MEVVDAAGSAALIDEAAQIWAEATAARDGIGDVPGLEISRPVIAGVLDRSPRAILLMARDSDGTAAGFAAVEPLAGRGAAQVTYLGVRPARWGQGVGEQLLQAVTQRLRDTGCTSAELSVYTGNLRAAALYERLGWQPRGLPVPHPSTGKPEQRYELSL